MGFNSEFKALMLSVILDARRCHWRS